MTINRLVIIIRLFIVKPLFPFLGYKTLSFQRATCISFFYYKNDSSPGKKWSVNFSCLLVIGVPPFHSHQGMKLT